MSNYATDVMDSPFKPGLTPGMRRNLLVALALAVFIELGSRVGERVGWGNGLSLQLLSIVAATLAGVTIVLLVAYTCQRRYITGTMVIAAIAIMGSALAHTTGELRVFDGFPILGSGGAYRGLTLSVADIVGIGAWIFGFFGLVFELHQAKSSLSEQHAILEGEVAERQRTEASLRDSEALFRAVFERVGIGIVIVDSGGQIYRCNNTFAAELGSTTEHMEDTNIAPLVVQAERANFLEDLHALSAPTSASCQCSYHLLHVDGRPICFTMALAAIPGHGDAPPLIAAVVENRTVREEYEQRVLQQQKMESVGILAGGIAHDFNNLFVGIMANAELLTRDVAGRPDSEAICHDIVSSTQRAAALCEQLLAYAGKAPKADEALDLSRLLKSSQPLLHMAVDRTAHLHVERAENLPTIQGDPSQIRQAMLNLIANASDALKGQHGEITVSTGIATLGPAEVLKTLPGIHPPPPGNFVFLSVADSGSGMSDDVVEKLCDPFFTTKKMGTGLGLAAVQGILRAHGGAIQLTSERGKGTEIRLLFPVAGPPLPPPANAAPKSMAKASPGTLTSATILLVDDEEMVIGAARRILERSGYAVVTARNGQEGVDVFRKKHGSISAVLLDLTMPVMDGETACREMKAIDPAVPVILCSGYSETESNESIDHANVAGYLKKPYRIKTLVETIESVVRRQA